VHDRTRQLNVGGNMGFKNMLEVWGSPNSAFGAGEVEQGLGYAATKRVTGVIR
jgi:hypothetical protein